MSDTPMTNAAQVPLVEQLRQVPKKAFDIVWSKLEPFPESASIPYGRMCHEAAEEIQKLERELAAVTAERDALRADFTALQVAIVGNTGASAILEVERLKEDARRYQQVRQWHWERDGFAVVANPKRSCRLGSYHPSGQLLDKEVDADIAASKEKP